MSPVKLLFPWTINRLGYLWRVILVVVLWIILALALCFALDATDADLSNPDSRVYLLINLLSVVLGVLSLGLVVAPRIRDTGKSGWWCLLTLIPLLGLGILLACFFVPSNKLESSDLP